MGLVGDGPERRGACAEALDDLRRGLDLIQWHGLALVEVELQLPADLGLLRQLILPVRVHPVGLGGVRPRRLLHLVDDVRRVHVRLRLVDRTVVVLPDVPQLLDLLVHERRQGAAGRVGELVELQGIPGEDVEAHSVQHRAAAREALGDDLLAQSDGLEELRTLVALQAGDAHLRHDLEDAEVHGRAEVLDTLRQREVATPDSQEAEIAEVGEHRIGSEAQQRAEVVHLADISGLDDNGHPCPQLRSDEVLVEGAGRQQGADRNPILPGAAVREDDEGHTVAEDRRLCLLADLVQALPEQRLLRDGAVRQPCPGATLGQRIGHVDRRR
mmetsp:Transcript_30320/g.87440  ORF Transcript_30320/g.87440 Transcript_30320/m.87440 type:complete len:328 (+) Transcript_30320:2602-3585(+)